MDVLFHANSFFLSSHINIGSTVFLRILCWARYGQPGVRWLLARQLAHTGGLTRQLLLVGCVVTNLCAKLSLLQLWCPACHFRGHLTLFSVLLWWCGFSSVHYLDTMWIY